MCPLDKIGTFVNLLFFPNSLAALPNCLDRMYFLKFLCNYWISKFSIGVDYSCLQKTCFISVAFVIKIPPFGKRIMEKRIYIRS